MKITYNQAINAVFVMKLLKFSTFSIRKITFFHCEKYIKIVIGVQEFLKLNKFEIKT